MRSINWLVAFLVVLALLVVPTKAFAQTPQEQWLVLSAAAENADMAEKNVRGYYKIVVGQGGKTVWGSSEDETAYGFALAFYGFYSEIAIDAGTQAKQLLGEAYVAIENNDIPTAWTLMEQADLKGVVWQDAIYGMAVQAEFAYELVKRQSQSIWTMEAELGQAVGDIIAERHPPFRKR